MRRETTKKLQDFKRYVAVIRLNNLLEEIEPMMEDDVEVTPKTYFYDCLELPWMEEFGQVEEVDEDGNVIVEDYVRANYDDLLVEAKEREYERYRVKYIAEARVLRYNEIETTYKANEIFDSMNSERSLTLIRNAVYDYESDERVKWINLKMPSVEVDNDNIESLKSLSNDMSRSLQASYDKLDTAINHIMSLEDKELYTFSTVEYWKQI